MISFALALGLVVSASSAAPISERLIFSGVPSQTQVSRWSHEKPRHFRFFLDVDLPSSMERLLQLPNALSIDICTNVYPTELSLALWQKLAEKGVGLCAQGDLIYPTEAQAERLNRIEFKRLALRFEKYPEENKGDLLGLMKLRSPYRLSLDAKRFPLALEVENFRKLTAVHSFEFITNYWPRALHMPLLERLGKPLALRIVDFPPTGNDLPYVNSIPHLQSLALVLRDPPVTADLWARLSQALPQPPVELSWINQGRSPEAQELLRFLQSTPGKRLITLQQNDPLTREQEKALAQAPGEAVMERTED